MATTYAYDEIGNRISQTDANGHTTTFAYDQLGRRSSRTLPLSSAMSESYSYDAAGNLASRTDFNGHTTTYQYDSMNRLLSKTADPFFSTGSCAPGSAGALACGATQVSYTYTATGRRASMADASGTTNYFYDPPSDRLVEKDSPLGSVTWQYDLVGNVNRIGGSTSLGTNYGYDQLNRGGWPAFPWFFLSLSIIEEEKGTGRVAHPFGFSIPHDTRGCPILAQQGWDSLTLSF